MPYRKDSTSLRHLCSTTMPGLVIYEGQLPPLEMLKSHGNTKSSTISEVQSNMQRRVYRTQMKAQRNLGKFLILWILLMKFNSYIHPFFK